MIWRCAKCLARFALEVPSSAPQDSEVWAYYMVGRLSQALEQVRDGELELCAEHKREQRKARARVRAEARARLEAARLARREHLT